MEEIEIMSPRGSYQLKIDDTNADNGEVKIYLAFKSEELMHGGANVSLLEVDISENLEEISTKTYHYREESGKQETIVKQEFLFYPPVTNELNINEVMIEVDEEESCLRINPLKESDSWIEVSYHTPKELKNEMLSLETILKLNYEWIKHALRLEGYRLVGLDF